MKNNNPKPKNTLLLGPMIVKIAEQDIPYTYFSSDLHIQHKNILHFTMRGKCFTDVHDMNIRLLDNIVNTVQHRPGHKTRYFHCGDLLFGTKGQCNEYLKDIQDALKDIDKVYAVVGNHDVDNILKYHNMIPAYGFNTTETYCCPNWFWNNMFIVEIQRNEQTVCRFTVSHFPMDEFHGKFNIHGHLHSEPIDRKDNSNNQAVIDKYRTTGTHFDCGVDNNFYYPVPLSRILENKTSIKLKHEINWQYDGYNKAES